jgi:hypothetical protein
LEGCHSFASDTELEVSSKEIRNFKGENREGHGPKIGRRAIEEEEEEEEEGEMYIHT